LTPPVISIKKQGADVEIGDGTDDDGPSVIFVVSDKNPSDGTSKLSAEVQKITPRAYKPLVVDNSGALPTLTIYEAGSYSVTLTKTRTNAGVPESKQDQKIISVRPVKRPIPALVTFTDVIPATDPGGKPSSKDDTHFSSTIELEGIGTFTVAAMTPGQNRNLAVLNRSKDELMQSATGSPVILAPTSPGALTISPAMTIDKTLLIDHPTQIAVIDLWTSEPSLQPYPTILISSREKKGGSIGPAATGPNVEFPEYTPPRGYPDGFNPSDKVETRVARLYYFRDAHRVAQIINRDVKSYNYVAVATARRQAEHARDAADQATDNRRLQEVKAVRAAQATRAAQSQLDQLQAQQASLQQQLNDAQQTANTPPPGANTTTPAATPAATPGATTGTTPAATPGATPGTTPAATPGATPGTTPSATPGATPGTTPAATPGATPAATPAGTHTATPAGTPAATLTPTPAAAAAASLSTQLDAVNSSITQAQAALQAARDNEAQSSDETVKDQALEDRARENQFRQEVAAAHEDPDTYAPAKVGSLDPVRQVSVSVIGEGEIQLRGPIKGINVIRMMINQIDAPVGQVRVGIHTVQINGEHGDRMEKVAGRIQDYIDHARFLTVQSAQLLRNAVVSVASQKAQEALAQAQAELDQQLALCPDERARQDLLQRATRSQGFRDRKYVQAFFGEDFVNELEEIDSEFLQSGNKLLALHSMDTTSLASALFLLAIAKNDVREEILSVFQTSLAEDLPQAEATYFEAGAGTRGKDHFHPFKLLASNAKFQSLRGFFNARVTGNDTINPLQREFIRLAQIFKSRLVTEIEFNQRVKERGLIEQRLGDYMETLRKQQRRQQDAEDALRVAQTSIVNGLQRVGASIEQVSSLVGNLVQPNEILDPILNDNGFLRYLYELNQTTIKPEETATPRITYQRAGWARKKPNDPNDNTYKKDILARNIPVELDILKNGTFRVFSTQEAGVKAVGAMFDDTVKRIKKTWDQLGQTQLFSDEDRKILGPKIDSVTAYFDKKSADFAQPQSAAIGKPPEGDPTDNRYWAIIDAFVLVDVLRITESLNNKQQSLSQTLRPSLNFLDKAFQKLIETDVVSEQPETAVRLIGRLIEALNEVEDSPVAKGSAAVLQLNQSLNDAESELRVFIPDLIKMIFVRRGYEASRRPLDTKKLLDMLIDDVEEKYIDLLEGTRSHTANVDAYIKAVATALDDDFNTQFYYPTFAEVRRASRLHDVTLADVETTNVLANNRGFAKVEPSATMEFDLPKRDILINEAMNGALAMTKDFGALASDPTFLSMAKLRSGQPTSSLAPGSGAGVNTVRNTLPGLPRSNDESLISQQGAGKSQFGSAMEALIPDPAVYKFETGTGFEIRPVIQPDGQSIVFHFNYMYTTNVREPVRADEKHLGRVKRHFIDTDVQLGNYELREVSRYQVALKASRTSRGIPLFEDIPGLGILFRPLPSAESSLQENIVLAQSTIFPTLFDLMGLRWAPAVADLDTLRLKNEDFTVRGRNRQVNNSVFDISSSSVDEFLRIPPAERRSDLYRSQETIPDVHPDGYRGSGLNFRDSHLREGYDPTQTNPESRFIPRDSRDLPDSDGPSDPGAGTGTLGSRRPGSRATSAIAARVGVTSVTSPASAVRGPSGSTRSGPTSGGALPLDYVPVRQGPVPPLNGPASALPPRTMGRPTSPSATGAAPGVGDSSVTRSSFTVTRPAAARPVVPPPAPRAGTPWQSSGRATGPVKRPNGPNAAKASGTPVDPDDKAAKPKRKSLLSRLRGTSE